MNGSCEIPRCYYSTLKKNLPKDIIDSRISAQKWKICLIVWKLNVNNFWICLNLGCIKKFETLRLFINNCLMASSFEVLRFLLLTVRFQNFVRRKFVSLHHTWQYKIFFSFEIGDFEFLLLTCNNLTQLVSSLSFNFATSAKLYTSYVINFVLKICMIKSHLLLSCREDYQETYNRS